MVDSSQLCEISAKHSHAEKDGQVTVWPRIETPPTPSLFTVMFPPGLVTAASSADEAAGFKVSLLISA